MQLNELLSPVPDGYRSDKDDNTTIDIKKTRQTRLSLDRLNKLRMMNDTRKLEHEKKLETVANQYKAPATAEGAPGL